MARIVVINKIIYILLLVLALQISLLAQTENDFSKNNIYIEFGGSGGLGSLNYERIIKKYYFIRVGAMVFPDLESEEFSTDLGYLMIPIGLGYLEQIGSNSFIDIGFGSTLAIPIDHQTSNNFSVMVNGLLGYRYQPEPNGFLFRTTIIPIVADGEFIIWFGVSFGYHF